MKNKLKKYPEEIEVVFEECPTRPGESEEGYRHLVENLYEAVYALDRNGVITCASPVIERLCGYKPSEITGRRFTELIHPDDLITATESLQRAKSGLPDRQDYRFVTKWGETRQIRSSSRPVILANEDCGIQGILADITEHKEAEESLRISEEGFRNSVDSTPLGIRIVNIDGETLYANQAMLDIGVPLS